MDKGLSCSPTTPPATENDTLREQVLQTAVHVLATEAIALQQLSELYSTHPVAQNGFVNSVQSIATSIRSGGKLVVIGVGKSGKIGKKMVATFNSVGLLSVFMHPVEALHGDLGILRENDTILLITYSGNTPELLALLPHIPQQMTVIALTSHTRYDTSTITHARPSIILLPAPIHELESKSFDLSAPTTSTTCAMALGDALALTVAKVVHVGEDKFPKDVFRRNHPGGAIGLGIGKAAVKLINVATLFKEMSILEEDLSPLPFISAASSDSGVDGCDWSRSASPRTVQTTQATVLDCLKLAVRSPKGWVRSQDNVVIPPRRLQAVRDPMTNILDDKAKLAVGEEKWVRIDGDNSVEEMKTKIRAARQEGKGEYNYPDGTVLAVMANRVTVGVLELEDLLQD
ncbi:SIS domain-containing protein [Ascobolus immersus RN42]|uniref:SIS domain-containing protein n=1 Tax=Ascobolus immersus RN42 TaxID=1160509 RepID=A0A3N4HY94_ASCIM|nr:SIS domain-containing protein [Ascobolus immersus RN42]